MRRPRARRGSTSEPNRNEVLYVNIEDVNVRMSVMNTVHTAEIVTRLKRHLSDVLSVTMSPERWDAEKSLPAILRQRYTFFTSRLLDSRCLFVVDRESEPNPPSSIRRQFGELARRWDGSIIYVAPGIDSSRRKRLIDQRIPFIVPGNQVYLPFFGIDLREHFKKLAPTSDSVSPATQALLLRILRGKIGSTVSSQQLAKGLGYTAMTISRAFRELDAAGIARHIAEGKRRSMEFAESPRAVWEKALPLLRDPVLRRTYVEPSKRGEIGLPAGLSALSIYTDLAAPANPVVAVAASAWRLRKENLRLIEIEHSDSGLVEVELWSYRPEAIAGNQVVDRLSLYLSVRDTTDERIEAARDQLLEGMEW